jgi:hypothetical protein
MEQRIDQFWAGLTLDNWHEKVEEFHEINDRNQNHKKNCPYKLL